MTHLTKAISYAVTNDEGVDRMSRERETGMAQRWKPVTDERGQGAVALVVVIAVVVAAVIMLIRTNQLASSIHSKTGAIAETGRGINTATDAILQLKTTNELGKSILATSEPLTGQLSTVVDLAKSIDGTATSINNTAVTVNGTAKGINSTAAGILTTGQRINDGVATINRNVDTAIDIGRKIHADTSNILNQANIAHNQLACTDEALAKTAPDGHCR